MENDKFELIVKEIIRQFYEESENWRKLGNGKYQRSTNVLWNLIEYVENMDSDLVDEILLERDEVH